MFLYDKYKPKNIKSIFFHKKIYDMIQKMSEDESIPHLCFYGANGSGRHTIVNILLEMIYNSDVKHLTNNVYTIIGGGNKEVEINIKQSNFHVIITPNNNNFDRYLIQYVVKKYAQEFPLNVFETKRHFKVILINNMDNLSYLAQTSLRRTMEKYSGTCRFIMICESLNKIIEPLQSRCLCIRVNNPTDEELLNYLLRIAYYEKIKSTLEDYTNIIKYSAGNIRVALLFLEQLKFTGKVEMSLYDIKINKIVSLILSNDLTNIEKIRDIIYTLLITNISNSIIIKDITKKLLSTNINNKEKIIKNASKYEFNLIHGRRDIMHFDAFIISIMCQ